MVREPTSSEIRSRNKLVEPEQERSMDRSSILRASTRINKRRSFERRFLWMSVRVGRLEGLAKEASDVRFRAFKEACARLIAVLPRILDSAIRVRANAFCALCDRLYYGNGNCLVTSDIVQPRVNKPGID